MSSMDKETLLINVQWFSPGPLVSSTNKTDRHDIIEILLTVTLNTIKQTNKHIQDENNYNNIIKL
jgi:hypothetical protein